MSDERRIRGKLLIAEPMLGDPNFHRAVILMVDHHDEGAAGVVLNRPTDLEVGTVLSEWGGLAASPPVLYVGGPVEPNGVLALARRRRGGDPPGWSRVLGDVGTLDLHVGPGALDSHVADIRFFLGYAGWGPGQLESELEAGAWLVVDARAEDAFADPDEMWRSVLRRQEGRVSMLANFPAHPSMN